MPTLPSIFRSFLVLSSLWFAAVVLVAPAQAAPCGNGVCQAAQKETCSSCAVDCGVCQNPSPTPTSAPSPSPQPSPSSQPSPSPQTSPTNQPSPISSPTTQPSPTSQPSPTLQPTSQPSPPPSGTGTPAPSSSTSPTASTSPNQPSTTNLSPTVTLNPPVQNPTNQPNVTFTGNASSRGGSLRAIEFRISSTGPWLPAGFNTGAFSFTTPRLPDGTHQIQVRALSTNGTTTPDSEIATQSVTVVTSPPSVTLDAFLQNPTKDQTPTVRGQVTDRGAAIVRVEFTFDGTNWIPATRVDGSYQATTTNELEDGNYPVQMRAVDAAGNVGTSTLTILIVDTLPPLIGGGMQSVGPLVIQPSEQGVMRLVAGAESTIALSMKGGVTEAMIQTSQGQIDLVSLPGSTLWTGKLTFDTAGINQLKVVAVDGASNRTERTLNALVVEKAGLVLDRATQTPVSKAMVSVYYYQPETMRWILWDGNSYQQPNPQSTSDSGSFSFLLPPGRYYLDVSAPGFTPMQSELLDIQEPQIINPTFLLRSKASLKMSLPLFGTFAFSLPTLVPDSLPATEVLQAPTISSLPPVQLGVGDTLPDFELQDTDKSLITSSSIIGTASAISFIAPWSPSSIAQAAIFSELSPELDSDNQIYAIMLQESVAAADIFMRRGKYSFPVLIDQEGRTAAQFGVSYLPQHFFIDSTGKIISVHNGVLSRSDLLERIQNLP